MNIRNILNKSKEEWRQLWADSNVSCSFIGLKNEHLLMRVNSRRPFIWCRHIEDTHSGVCVSDYSESASDTTEYLN